MCEFPKERRATGQWLKGFFFFGGSQGNREPGNQGTRETGSQGAREPGSQTMAEVGTYSPRACRARGRYDIRRYWITGLLITGLLDYWITGLWRRESDGARDGGPSRMRVLRGVWCREHTVPPSYLGTVHRRDNNQHIQYLHWTYLSSTSTAPHPGHPRPRTRD